MEFDWLIDWNMQSVYQITNLQIGLATSDMEM